MLMGKTKMLMVLFLTVIFSLHRWQGRPASLLPAHHDYPGVDPTMQTTEREEQEEIRTGVEHLQ